MARAFVVDASSFKTIYDDVVADIGGSGFAFLAALFVEDFIAVDDGDLIRQEWRDCSCGEADEFFKSWMASKIIEDRIRAFAVVHDKAVRAKLLEFGVPNEDKKYIYLAVVCSAHALVSDDVDHFEPSAKTKPAKYREKIMAQSSGCVAKYLRKSHGVRVVRLTEALAVV